MAWVRSPQRSIRFTASRAAWRSGGGPCGSAAISRRRSRALALASAPSAGRGGRALRVGPGASRISACASSSAYRTQRSRLLREGASSGGQRRGVARCSHLHGGALAHRPGPGWRARSAGERVDQRAEGEPEAPARGHLLERGEIHQQRLAVGPGDRLAAVGGEQRDQRLVALGDLVADDDRFLLAAGQRPHVDAALAQGLEQRQHLRGRPSCPAPPPAASCTARVRLDHVREAWRSREAARCPPAPAPLPGRRAPAAARAPAGDASSRPRS